MPLVIASKAVVGAGLAGRDPAGHVETGRTGVKAKTLCAKKVAFQAGQAETR